MSQLKFRGNIVTSYLLKYQALLKTKGKPTVVILDIHHNGIQHYITNVPEGKRKKCSYENSNGRGRTMCIKCDKDLCILCFTPFHT